MNLVRRVRGRFLETASSDSRDQNHGVGRPEVLRRARLDWWDGRRALAHSGYSKGLPRIMPLDSFAFCNRSESVSNVGDSEVQRLQRCETVTMIVDKSGEAGAMIADY